MNRRNFLASLVALPAAAKVVAREDEIIEYRVPQTMGRRLGYTLTSVPFYPIGLTPKEFAAMGEQEEEYGKQLRAKLDRRE